MAVTTVGSSTATFSFAGFTVTKPSGVQVNDLILILFGANGTANTPATVSGFASYHADVVTESLQLLYRIADGTEGSSFASSSLANEDGAAGCLVLRGIDTVTPILAVSADQTASSTSPSWAGASWAGAADVVSLLASTWQSSAATVTWPSGWNQSPDGLSASDGYESLAVACDLTTVPAATSLVSQTGTLSASEAWETNQYALKVAGAAAPVGPSQFPHRAPRA